MVVHGRAHDVAMQNDARPYSEGKTPNAARQLLRHHIARRITTFVTHGRDHERLNQSSIHSAIRTLVLGLHADVDPLFDSEGILGTIQVFNL